MSARGQGVREDARLSVCNGHLLPGTGQYVRQASGLANSRGREVRAHICKELMATASCPKEALQVSMELLSDRGQCPYRVFSSNAGVASSTPAAEVSTPALASPSVDMIWNVLDGFDVRAAVECILID